MAVSFELPPDPCVVRGDVARLRQVVGNLLSNAVKFTASGGRVDVNVTCTPSQVTITVSDTGIGIHPDFLPYIFEPFRQAEGDATAGLGLGLAIVKNLVELHGGSVVAESDGTGRGARFTIALPLSP